MTDLSEALDLITNPRALEHQDKTIVQALMQAVEVRISAETTLGIKRPKGAKYVCMEHWVLEHGHYFPFQPYDETAVDYDLEMGEIKQCFGNAYGAAIDNPEVVTYVEGFGMSIFPVNHAWVTLETEDRPNMVDLTWREEGYDGKPREIKPEYFGVPFDLEYVDDVTTSKGTYGIINNWEMGFPLLMNDDHLNRAIHPDWR